MKIFIGSSTLVKPASETPQHTIWNSNIDLVIPRIHVPTVYFYKAKVGEEPGSYLECEHLKESLARALVPFYPMAGRLKDMGKGRLDIDCNGGGVLFMEASADGCMSEYGEFFPPCMKMRELIPRVDYSDGPASFPLLILQVTSFKCGGVSIGMGVHHHVADGLAALRFINYWANLSRGFEEDVKLFFDRTLLRARDPPTPKFAHVEYQAPPSLLNAMKEVDLVKVNGNNVEVVEGVGNHAKVNGNNTENDCGHAETNGTCIKATGDLVKEENDYGEVNAKMHGEFDKASADFSNGADGCIRDSGTYIPKQEPLPKKIRNEEHDRLREGIAKVNEEQDDGEDYGEGGPIVADLFVFSDEFLESLKISATEHATPGERPFSSYEVLASHVWRCACLARDLQGAQMTKLYIATDGRSRLQPALPSDYFGNVIFTATPVGCAGRIVKEPLADTVRCIRKTVQIMDDEYLRSALDFLELQPNLACFSRGAHSFGTPNLGITSWVKLPIYGADFGWGPPLSMAPAGVPFEGLAYLLPGPPGDTRLRLSITLTPHHMRQFRELIYKV